MAIKDMQGFVDKAFQDDALVTAIGKSSNVGDIVALGKQHGFNFSAEEANQAKEMLSATSTDGELSDGQLEMVAGGGWGADANSWLRRASGDANRAVNSQVNEARDFFSGW